MMNAEHIRTIVGIIGNFISFLLFLAPVPTFVRIWKNKSTEQFQPFPYLATVMNCLMWIFYGLPIVHPDSLLVVTINGIGLVMEIGYLCVYLYYGNKKGRVLVVSCLAVIVALFIALVVLILTVAHTHVARSKGVGIICIVFGICMYASPLMALWKVIKTRSVEFMPFWLSLAACTNGCIWTAYALLKFDLYILIANGAGAGAGLIQLLFYGGYCWTEESKLAKHKGKLPTSTKTQG